MRLNWLKRYNHADLLKIIDQQEVWINIIGHGFKPNAWILNPLRDDKHLGSCYLENRNGKILLIDWADSKYSGLDCISAYMLKYLKTWEELCLEFASNGYIRNTKPAQVAEEIPRINIITPIYRNFNQKDDEFWNKRGVTTTQLSRIETLTKPIVGYIHEVNGKKSTTYISDIGYAYHCMGKVKLYFPNRKTYKFLGNQKRTDVWFLDRGNPTLLVCKSQKEMLLWENMVEWNLTHVQSESFSKLDKALVYSWEINHDRIIFNFDNDTTGKRASDEFKKSVLYKQSFQFSLDPTTGFKDIDEMYITWGKEKTQKYIKDGLNICFKEHG